MKKEVIVTLHAAFEEIVRTHPDSGLEFWLARELQPILGYTKWENFAKVIDKAKKSCETSGNNITDHFLDVRKMIEIGKGGTRN
ncbi:BRO family protein [Methylovulum miyakonense]|uniref:BRO family protein n=1 Tax=Methylovulum miyakonense TaxID=645578 RepID=UPI000375E57C|nr:BRO family protein [Methylovulum miyakonense]